MCIVRGQVLPWEHGKGEPLFRWVLSLWIGTRDHLPLCYHCTMCACHGAHYCPHPASCHLTRLSEDAPSPSPGRPGSWVCARQHETLIRVVTSPLSLIPARTHGEGRQRWNKHPRSGLPGGQAAHGHFLLTSAWRRGTKSRRPVTRNYNQPLSTDNKYLTLHLYHFFPRDPQTSAGPPLIRHARMTDRVAARWFIPAWRPLHTHTSAPPPRTRPAAPPAPSFLLPHAGMPAPRSFCCFPHVNHPHAGGR